ncbi:MAG: substrate-binding domain-containing protein [Deltaproteobacteria bacterium]|nr:substrate-binding domain-containing protein [Deltaproteobacteria bacterium]
MTWFDRPRPGPALVVVMAAALCLLLVACDDAPKEKTPARIVLIPKVTGNAFFEEANNGAQKFAEKNGFIVEYRGSDTADVQNQVEIVRQAVRDGAQGISISALEAGALDEVLKEAMSRGLAVTTWDSDVSADARTLMVSQGTPEQLGTMLVEMASKSLRQRGKSPTTEEIKYAWHYSQASVSDQNSWNKAGEDYIRRNYPQWVNVAPSNYYSRQDPVKAVEVGRQILTEHPDIDVVICNDSTSLPGQAQAAKELGRGAGDVTITGFASPNAMKDYARDGVVARWGLWDCRVQAALSCFLTNYLAGGNKIQTGRLIEVPDIGLVEVMPNSVLDPAAANSPDSGVILLPARTEFTVENMDDYDF